MSPLLFPLYSLTAWIMVGSGFAVFQPGPCTFDGDSLRLKVGQMVMAGFRGLTVDEMSPIVRDIVGLGLGGVILFDYDVETKSPVRNISGPAQLRRLTSTLQRFSRIPLLIAVDQEGGKVSRLKRKHGFPDSPSQASLGGTGRPEKTREYAMATGRLLNSHGVNVNFAPVLDVNVNPENPVIGRLERSYSSDPDSVVLHGRAALEGMRCAGMLAAVKHFPGHGSSRDDSHLGLVDVTETWSQAEMKPFAALIAEGLCDMVMTAHVYHRGIDSLYPATLSRRFVTGILRDSLGFDGVIVTDDLQMRAIREHYGLETAVRLAVEAGNDILLFANNTDSFDEGIARKAVAALLRLVEDGTIPAERIDASYRRIMELKARLRDRGQ
ncbi:MAG: glycoside hydrolase family 3 protein [Bacteroidota bacterium]|nr:glycoside hydrolase family 3 protein [Bacteroidota bacterium]